MTAMAAALRRALGWAVPATPQERAAALWSFAYFFMLLAGYYVLRPLRDQMGIAGGVKNLPWLFTATFVTLLVAQPLYGALVAKLPRARFIAVVYHFFVANLALFWLLLTLDVAPVVVARVFFVWVSVFNLFAVAVFWSFMADLFDSRAGQAALRLHRRRRHRRLAARPGHHHRPFGAARPRQPADRRRRCCWNSRCSASTGSSARPMRRPRPARRAVARRRQRLRGAARALPLALSARRRRVGQPAVLLRDHSLSRAGQHRRRRRPRRRRADAHLRQHRSGGRAAQPGDAGLRHRAAAQAVRHRRRRRARCRRSMSRASPRWRWRRRSPSWWCCRSPSAG